jgi:hypothetical protein
MSCCDYTVWDDENLNHPSDGPDPEPEPLSALDLARLKADSEERAKKREEMDRVYREWERKEIAQIEKDHEGFEKRLPYYLVFTVCAIIFFLI